VLIRKRALLTGLASLLVGSSASATDITRSLTFVGIKPCRIIDTRASQGFSGQWGPPALAANADRTFRIVGTTSGTPTQCGIPPRAQAISANFTVTGFAGAGDIRVGPAGSALPLTSILNYRLETIANATSVPLGLVGDDYGIVVRADASATELIVDVNGYYLSDGAVASAFINNAGSVVSGTPNVSSSFNAQLDWYEITIAGENYHYSSYVTVVTPVTSGLHWRVSSVGGKLLVSFTDSAGAPTASGFQFVTFKP
jgi:hypothetical protein